MRTSLLIAIAAAATIVGSTQLRSQAPVASQSPLEAVRAMRVQNQKLLEQQTATLQRLDELKKESAQMRIFARRS